MMVHEQSTRLGILARAECRACASLSQVHTTSLLYVTIDTIARDVTVLVDIEAM